MALRPTVLLFDIDGTLVSTGGAGRRALERAFVEHTGSAVSLDFTFAGLTDPAIVRRGLSLAGRPDGSEAIVAVLASYLRALPDEVATTPSYIVHAGVLAALDAMSGRENVAIGLGTGNIRDGAKVKLGRAKLFERFAFGGFGSDSEDRAELLSVGACRGAEALGASMSECRVVVIGDTPKDILAAKAIGAESFAVATGQYTVQELREHEPTWLFESLAAAGALAALSCDASVREPPRPPSSPSSNLLCVASIRRSDPGRA